MRSLRALAEGAGDVVLSSPPASCVGRRINRSNLRVLAYHGIDDAAAFDRQMAFVRDLHVPVEAQDVIAALKGDHPLPDNAVWVTFDDGEPSVARNGMTVLEAQGIKATMFICPSVIDTSQPLWWQLVEISARNGILPEGQISETATVSMLKSVDDGVRSDLIDDLREQLKDTLGEEPRRPQLTTIDLLGMRDAGHTLGNHTWTHPLLDRCSPSTQRDEIVRAHDWFTSHLQLDMSLFSYPNGNHTAESESVLADLGYDVATLFNHRIAVPAAPHLQLSRLRVSDENSMGRFSAILAGTHPFVHQVRAGRKVGK